jgi:DUF1365 family protein
MAVTGASTADGRAWNSAIYLGSVRHRRRQPKIHQFRFPMFMLYLDLDELPEVFDQSRWYSSRGFALAQFRREDHLGDPSLPLSHCVRELVHERTGHRPRGAIRLLTHLRYFGYCFNPASFYYCFDQDDETLECVVVEVNNTPWGEQHCYVLDAASNTGQAGKYRWNQAKSMHVSPFMPMDVQYEFRLSKPARQLSVHMQNHSNGACLFDAWLNLERQAVTARSLGRVLWRFPLMTMQVIIAIHWQALRIWLKGVPVHDHPGRANLQQDEIAQISPQKGSLT